VNPSIKQMAATYTWDVWSVLMDFPALTESRNPSSGSGPMIAAATLVLALLSGCGSAPPLEGSDTLREANRLEAAATAQRAVAAPGQALADLERAARLYALMDDSMGVVRVYLTISRIHEHRGETAIAARYADAALQLAGENGDPAARYRALLVVGRLRSDSDRFEQALAVAPGALQQAVALTYLERYAEAYTLTAGLTEPEPTQVGDLAFVLHGYAQNMLAQDAAERALALYKRSDNYRGIAGCLHLLADIAERRGAQAASALYRARAARVESAIEASGAITAETGRSR